VVIFGFASSGKTRLRMNSTPSVLRRRFVE
jgi:hypothetical protein